MKTTAEIKAEIAKLEKGLNNPNVPDAFKKKGREKIADLKKELAKAEKPNSAPKDKPKSAPKPAKEKPAPKAKKPKSEGKGYTQKDSENYIKRLAKRATEIQEAGGLKDNEECKKKVYKINRADAVKKAAREIKYDANNKNRSQGMDGTKKKK